MNIKCLLGFHPYLKCEPYNPYGLEPETRITFSSPWALFGTRETQYECQKCKRKFWFPAGDMAEMQMKERILESLSSNLKE